MGETQDFHVGNEFNSTLDDLRGSPAILIGAFNNEWTLQLTAGLHMNMLAKNQPLTMLWMPSPGKRPKDWEHKNLQVVITAQVIDGHSGPPRTVTACFW